MLRALAMGLVMAGLVMGWAGSAGAAEPITIRFSHIVAEDTPKGIGANLLKQRIEERLAGKVRVEVYPRSQKFTDEQVLEALLFGDVDLAAPSLSKFRNYTKRLQVFDLPYVFDDVEAVQRFEASKTGRQLLDSMSARDIKGLAYWHNGMRVISSNEPIKTPADLKGLTIRIEPSAVIEATYETLGAVPLRLPFERVLEALKTGLADGEENTWSNIYTAGYYEAQKYVTETNHSFLGYMVVTSSTFWDGLPPDIRASLEAILAEVTAEVNKIALEKAQSDRERVQTAITAVITPTAMEREAWRAALQPVWARFEGDIGKETIDAAVAANRE